MNTTKTLEKELVNDKNDKNIFINVFINHSVNDIDTIDDIDDKNDKNVFVNHFANNFVNKKANTKSRYSTKSIKLIELIENKSVELFWGYL